MAARNKPPGVKGFGGRVDPILVELPVQAGATQEIKSGEVCTLLDPTDIASYPIVPAVAGDKDFIPLIAWEEQKSTDAARLMKFALPTNDMAFEFALDAGTAVKIGDKLGINDSQSLKVQSTGVIAAAWTDPVNATPTWQTVTTVWAVFLEVGADKYEHFPFVGGKRPEASGGLDFVIADPGDAGAVPVTSSGYCPIVTAGAETRTVAIPSFAGQLLMLQMKTDAGDCVVTFAQAFNEDGDTTVTLDDAGDMATFVGIYVGTALRWRLISAQGATSLASGAIANVITDPGDGEAIPVTESGHCPIVTAGAETRTLADASFTGQQMLLLLKTDGGDCVITAASPINQEGRTTITLDTVGDSVLLTAVEDGADIEWRVTGANGVEALDVNTEDLAESANGEEGAAILIHTICTAGGAEDEVVLAAASRKMKIADAWMIARTADAANVTLKNVAAAFTGAIAIGGVDDTIVSFATIIAEHDEIAAGAAINASFSAAGSAEIFILAYPIA